ncbi:MAG TPA: hypothetical protein VFO58_11775 [Vicinamibacterales bacterium]|nr:hypothetical protein [Vicinamibacterales bacterium]
MACSRRACSAVAVVLGAVLCTDAASMAQSDSEARKPSLSLRVTPSLGFTPLKARFAVDVRGGDDDFEDFYCPTIEWSWGDGTVSSNSEDCDPYEAGKSLIRRRFSAEHVYRQPGTFRVSFRLKQQKTRVVGTANTILQVRAGGSQN